MPKLQENKTTKQFTITIPRRLVLFQDWYVGDEIFFVLDEKQRISMIKK